METTMNLECDIKRDKVTYSEKISSTFIIHLIENKIPLLPEIKKNFDSYYTTIEINKRDNEYTLYIIQQMAKRPLSEIIESINSIQMDISNKILEYHKIYIIANFKENI